MKIHELLANPEAWTQGGLAFSLNGDPVPPQSPRACRWCLSGAAEKCYGPGPDLTSAATTLSRAIAPSADESFNVIFNFNDAPERKHSEVLELVKRLDV